jgi:hypothetical protein
VRVVCARALDEVTHSTTCIFVAPCKCRRLLPLLFVAFHVCPSMRRKRRRHGLNRGCDVEVATLIECVFFIFTILLADSRMLIESIAAPYAEI